MKRSANTFESIVIVEGKHKPIHFGFCLALDTEVDEAALRAALDETKVQYPLIAVRVVQDGAKRYLLDSDQVAPFPITTYARSERPWTELLDVELRKPFPMDAGPATRFALRPAARGTELYCVFHHAFADGHSAVRHLDLLLTVLGGAGRAKPAVRELDLFASLRSEVVEALSRRPAPRPPPAPPPLDPAELARRIAAPYRAPAAFAIRSWALSGEETSRLVAASRGAGVTVHAALGAAWLMASAEILGASGSRLRTIQFPVDFRPYLVDEARDGYGVYFGIVTADVDCAAGRSIAEVARDIKRELDALRRDRKDIEEAFSFRDALGDLSDVDAALAAFPERTPGYDFSLSNLGRLPLATSYGGMRLEAIWGPTFSAVNGERVIGVNTHGGVLRMTDIWDPERCDSAAYDRIREGARSKLSAFLAR